MRTLHRLLVPAALQLWLAGCGSRPQPAPAPAPEHEIHGAPQTLADWAHGAKLFEGLGDFHRKVTASSQAQRYFDQGMRLLWAFNHDESTRSFAKGAELDPRCAMCYWGVALTVGPNYNLPLMAEPRAKVAWEALQLAQQKAPATTPVEQALIGALGQRYRGPEALDPSNLGPLLTAYAEALQQVAKKFPDDLDVQTLYAEARMNLNAWKLWTPDGQPAPGTAEIEATLASVLARDPGHPGANHYYIHTVEASPHPERALAAAERLNGMMPMAGHLQHMPAHILQRVGRYAEAAEANRKGAQADRAYMAETKPLDYYGVYLGHNYQFLAYSTAMQGRKHETLEAARKSYDAVPAEMLAMMPGMDWYLSEVYSAMIRFGLWDELLAEPAPDPRLSALTGGYLYGKGMALAAKGRVSEARVALAQLEKHAADTPPDSSAGLNLSKDVFAVAELVLKAQLAKAEGRTAEAVSILREAVAREDGLAYDEPSDWFFPVRHQLGAELLRMGKAPEAEAVYREDLARHPQNGWSLYGLAAALKAQNKTAAAAQAEQQFHDAWKDADVTLAASAF